MGKGADGASARVSCLMEAIERVSAERVPSLGAVRGSFADLCRDGGPPPVDPRAFDLPDDTDYSPSRPLLWLPALDLQGGAPVRMPADLCCNPPREGLLKEVDTNGLASGNSLLEAAVHGLCEVIERDAQSQLELAARFADPGDPEPPARPMELASLPDSARSWIERLLGEGLEVAVHEIGGDLGVASFRCLISDLAYPGRGGTVTQHFVGWGTAPQAELALVRSVTEAVQSRLGVVQASRDSFNTTRLGRSGAARSQRRRIFEPTRRLPFAAVESFASPDLRGDLRFLLARLKAAGIERVLVADLTRADLGVPVVRVRVPGLACFSVNRRRVGWRCLRHLL
jgi:ribosomal protein S12 methylthiotransferase accessory factor